MNSLIDKIRELPTLSLTDREALNFDILNLMKGYVLNMAVKYNRKNPNLDIQDLIQEGNLAILKKVHRIIVVDTTTIKEVENYLYYTIVDAMNNYVSNFKFPIKYNYTAYRKMKLEKKLIPVGLSLDKVIEKSNEGKDTCFNDYVLSNENPEKYYNEFVRKRIMETIRRKLLKVFGFHKVSLFYNRYCNQRKMTSSQLAQVLPIKEYCTNNDEILTLLNTLQTLI